MYGSIILNTAYEMPRCRWAMGASREVGRAHFSGNARHIAHVHIAPASHMSLGCPSTHHSLGPRVRTPRTPRKIKIEDDRRPAKLAMCMSA